MSKPESTPAPRRRLDRAVDRYMAAAALWPVDGRLLVGVSGGPDSSALLAILRSLAPPRDVELTAAHFDHGLRGAAVAAAERAAVEALCHGLGVPLVCGGDDVRGLAGARHLSLEEAARIARYRFLAAAARQTGCSVVAVGHTEDDQAETVLMHLLRGAGLAGLGGMAPRSVWPLAGHADLELVRPLLALSRTDTESYCAAAAIQPVDDESNRSPAHLRNRLRQEALPDLERYNPRLRRSLARLAAAARGDLAALESIATAAVRPAGREVVISRDLVAAWPAALQVHAGRAALRAAAGDLRGFSERHLGALRRLMATGNSGDGIDLPRGLRATVRGREVVLAAVVGETPSLPEGCATLSVPGSARLGDWHLAAGDDSTAAPDAALTVLVDAEAVGAELWLRRRRPGDRFQPLGMTGTKKLQDYFIDARVARAERDALPLVEARQGIVWVGGQRLAEWARPRSPRAVVRLALWRRLDDGGSPL